MKKTIRYFYVVDEDGDQRTLLTTSYREAQKDLKELQEKSSGFHKYDIECVEEIDYA